MIKICKLCGKEFTTNKNAAKYCDESCAIKAHREQIYQCKARQTAKKEACQKEEAILYRQKEEARLEAWTNVLNKWKADRIAEGHANFFMPYEWKTLQADFNRAWEDNIPNADV